MKKYITDIKDVPDFGAMSAEDIVDWLENHELSYELDVMLSCETKLEDDLKAVGLPLDSVHTDSAA